jgi:hypothetical protein
MKTMKKIAFQFILIALITGGCNTSNKNLAGRAEKYSEGYPNQKDEKSLFMDFHHLGAGNVTFEAVMEAHKKDLEVQDQYGVRFIKFWVDEKNGSVTCLSEARKAEDVVNVHRHAHGLIPGDINIVMEGE